MKITQNLEKILETIFVKFGYLLLPKENLVVQGLLLT